MKTQAIIVTYNGMKWLEHCLNSLLNSSIPIEIIVIDNYSIDGTVDYIKSNFKSIVLIEQKENLGFGKANNIGLAYALKCQADYVFLLNQDACVDINTIEVLINTGKKYKDYGIISPIHLDYSGKSLEYYFYKFMASSASKSFYSDYVLTNEIKNIYEVPFIQAAAWLLPINTLKKIGGFDPLFFHYGEDDNYCQRVLFHNMKIGIVPGAFIKHDSNTNPKPVLELFSSAYFLNYKKQLYVKYGDLNLNLTRRHIENERYKIYKLMITGFLSFKVYKIKGACKQFFILRECIENIVVNRKKSLELQSNYIISNEK
jgi:GT2 family glycosyltransferase